jgi:hypothetical protein
MPGIYRLEDLTSDWQKYSAGLIEQAVPDLVHQLGPELPDPIAVQSPEVIAKVTETARQVTRRFGELQLLPACLAWLQANQHWPHREANMQRVQAELATALEHLPRLQPILPAPTSVLSPWGWVLPAGGGAALGALLLTPLALLLFGNREVGLFLGGVLGAVVVVAFLALLATRPRLLSMVRASLATAGAVTLGGGVWQAVRGRSFGWLKASGYLLAGWLLVYTLRPRVQLPSRAECVERLTEQLRALLRHDADLILGWCWSHPERVPPTPVSPTVATGLPEPICTALTSMRSALTGPDVQPEELQDAASALLQRVEEQGFEWKAIERGTLYAEAMTQEFDQFALISVGQPVETLQPAVLRRGEVIKRGLLRRLRT